MSAVTAGMLLVNLSFVEGKSSPVYSDYLTPLSKILIVKENDPRFFTRLFRLSPSSFDRLLRILTPTLSPLNAGGTNIIPPMIQLCVALRMLAGGSYLDISLFFDVKWKHVHTISTKVWEKIDECSDPYVNNIKFPINDYEKLRVLEIGFASLSKGKIRGTVAAGDGIVFKMNAPTNEEVDDDEKSYYTRKGFYGYGLQVCLKIIYLPCNTFTTMFMNLYVQS